VLTPAPEPTPPDQRPSTPAGWVEELAYEILFDANELSESLVASASDWQIEIDSNQTTGASETLTKDLNLKFNGTSSAANILGRGLMPFAEVSFWLFSEPTFVGVLGTDSSGNFSSRLAFPDSLAPGDHTLQMLSRDALGRAITLNFPILVTSDEVSEKVSSSQKVNAGSFKGYVAIYAKGHEGQRLSAKVGNDWVIVPGIPAAKNNLYRHVEYAGTGVDIAVRIYIDRVLIDTINLRTK
jgi:hypothetical protein